MAIRISQLDSSMNVLGTVERDIKLKKDGLFTFTLRVNGGNIVDYSLTEYVDVKRKYLGVTKTVIAKSTVTYYPRK